MSVQFHIQLLSLIQEDVGEEYEFFSIMYKAFFFFFFFFLSLNNFKELFDFSI
jgi:hypothetical protein